MTTSTAELRRRKDLDPGWWRSQTGPAQVLILTLGALVLFALVYLGFVQDSGRPRAVPSVVGQGEAIALKQLDAAGFHHVKTHDALGRDRSGQAQQWQVCFQLPEPGPSRRPGTHVVLGLARTTEGCPPAALGDRGIVRAIHVDDPLPDFTQPTNWTAYIVGEDLGDDASVRFVERSDPGHTIRGNLGDWLVCTQTPAPHQPWHGRPITLAVAHYDRGCG
jgi:hypothetical protein